MLRHYDAGPCRSRLGHSRVSVVWHRTQVKNKYFFFHRSWPMGDPHFDHLTGRPSTTKTGRILKNLNIIFLGGVGIFGTRRPVFSDISTSSARLTLFLLLETSL